MNRLIERKFIIYLSMQIRILLCFILGALAQYPWVKPGELNYGLPPSVEIYTLNTSSSPFSTKLTGAMAKINMNDPNLQFIVKDTNGDALGYFPKTPVEYAQTQENVVYAVINGGYFDMIKNISSSFLAEGGRVKTRTTINQGGNNHPTVGAFGSYQNGSFSAEYIYSYEPTLTTYRFPYPNHFPGPIPNPDEGQKWKVQQGIGAGPILVKDGSIITGNVEHFNESYMLNTRHPRSAICVDKFNNLYLVAIDGRYDGSEGLFMSQIGQLMLSLNCRDAMNLDGGGSTLLYANGKIITRPCDPTGPRKVVSAVLIRDKFKKKLQESLIR